MAPEVPKAQASTVDYGHEKEKESCGALLAQDGRGRSAYRRACEMWWGQGNGG